MGTEQERVAVLDFAQPKAGVSVVFVAGCEVVLLSGSRLSSDAEVAEERRSTSA